MRQVLRILLQALAITIASIAIFILAAGLFPGDPGRFYYYVAIFSLVGALLSRLLLMRYAKDGSGPVERE